MAGKTKQPQVKETPSQRFDRVAKQAMERSRRAREQREAKERAAGC